MKPFNIILYNVYRRVLYVIRFGLRRALLVLSLSVKSFIACL
ncbi:hypothetical protein HMPREF1991_01402 [Hoylesella loescheii DSM 19665 = JCM 12249 = ATCC 15930]|uniref:Uncharacterized protein n=1 Tax=Hoylesella loescheii DSM 19665 = JCM 12249 = ATCC 15930 TaxID=1122985 RepID=A0A069QKE5_HOYLO|nr:hypothetical protein HMPREF1991_01402 [Hoylesella loescheii DSM 19665 = JCM 12249 = ATCC 15930]